MVRREDALTSLLAEELDGEPDAELMISAPHVSEVDVVTGAAIRMRIARHLRKHVAGGVTIVPPRDATVAGRLLDLLEPLPGRVVVTAREGAGEGSRFALLPATQIADAQDARLAGEMALDASEGARIADDRAAVIALAAMELADNALACGRRRGPAPGG